MSNLIDLGKAIESARAEDATRWVYYVPPGADQGFEVCIKYVPPRRWRKIQRSLNGRMNERARELAIEKRMRRTVADAIVDWRGLSPQVLLDMVPVREDAFPEDLTEIPYSAENALVLVEECPDFSGFLIEEISQLAAFRERQTQEALKN